MSEIKKDTITIPPQTSATSSGDEEQSPNESQLQQQQQQQQQQELPEFNLTNVLGDIKFGLFSLFVNPDFSKPISVLILLAESILLKIIIAKIPYTEIDYSTYMQQISLVESGELDYLKISGDTGPIVYPGGYVFIYSWMKWVTNSMDNLDYGQFVFRWLYLLTLLVTLVVYFWGDEHATSTKKKVKKITPMFLYLLVISKRLHSIYVLRLFNDCFTTLFALLTLLSLQIAVYFKQQNQSLFSVMMTYLASDLLSVAISVKMNALLYLPGFLLIIYFINDENLLKCLGNLVFGVFVQIGINWQFLEKDELTRAHFISGAFNFKREFLYKWTVNWKFLSEEVFLDSRFHKLLLALHIITIGLFIVNKWLQPKFTGKSLLSFIQDFLKFWSNTITPNNIILNPQYAYKFVMLVMCLSNLIGVLFARSLHYQFLSWYHFSLPYLLFNCNVYTWAAAVIMVVHELCWNEYPSTEWSSGTLIVILGLIVVSSYFVDPFKEINGNGNETATEIEKKEQ